MPDAAKTAQLSFRVGVHSPSRYIETMKCAGPLIFAVTLLLAAAARAQDATAPDKPYASIVTRNMFGLVPIPVVDPNANQPPADPPPKITPNGIMTIFGKLQALFKVANKTKPGQPDDSYVLCEGERQDDIEVVKINQPDGLITFNNHGIIQELPLVAPKDTGPAVDRGHVGGGGAGFNPGMRPNGGMAPAAGGNNIGFGGRVGRNRNNFDPGANNPNHGNTDTGGVSGFGRPPAGGSQNMAEHLTPEEQIISIEAQRAKWLDEGNPDAIIIPPTELTPQLMGEGNTAGGSSVPDPAPRR
jgi:hypothetical protein